MGVTYDEGDAREEGEFFGGTLGVTSGDQNFCGWILGMNFANGVARLSVGGGGDRAGVDDDELGAEG